MSRILNKEELTKLVDLGLVESKVYDNFRFKLVSKYGKESITEGMIGQKLKYADKYDIEPWMIKKSWKKTGIFNK